MSISLKSIFNNLLDFPSIIGTFILKIQASLQGLFRINPTMNQKLGFMNTLILVSGIALVLNYFQSTTIDSRNSLILLIIATGLFMWSVIYNTNAYSHSIIALFIVLLSVKLVGYFGVLLNPLALVAMTLILLLLCVYMDLLKPNFVLQITSIMMISRLIIEPFISSTLPLKIGPIVDFEIVNLINSVFPILVYVGDNISGFAVYGLLVLPFFWVVNEVFKHSKRTIFHKFYTIILHIATVLSLFLVSISSSMLYAILALTFMFSFGFYNFVVHKYTIGRVYITAFVSGLIALIYHSDVFGSSINQGLISISLLSILIATLVGKAAIDRSNRL